MPKSLSPYAIVAILLLCFSSCTIEKRKYTNGFHTERIHRNHQKTIHAEKRDQLLASDKKVPQTEVDSIKHAQSASTSESLKMRQPEDGATNQKIESKETFTGEEVDIDASAKESMPHIEKKSSHFKKLVQKTEKTSSKSLGEKKKKKTKIYLGTVSAILGLAAWIMLIVVAASIAAGTFSLTYFIIWILGDLLGIASFIMGLVALKKAKKKKGLTGAIIGIILGSLFAIGFVIGLIFLLKA